MTTIDYRVYNAHAKQRRFHKAVRQHDYVLFNGGRGSGKTTAGAIQGILEATQYQPGSAGVVIAPTYPMLEDASMKEFFDWLPRHWIRNFNRQRKVLELLNDSEIAFRSADNPDSLRGPNRQWAWFDEPRNLRNREAFDIVSAQLRPTRKMWLTTTPSGLFTWLYELFVAQPLQNSTVINVKTEENIHLPPEYAAVLRSQYTGAFALQELDAMWVNFEGLIFSNFSLDYNVTPLAEYNPDWAVRWGVDDGHARGQGPGHESYHPRVFLLGQITPIGGVNIFAEHYRTDELTEATVETVLGFPYTRPDIAYIDSSADELKRRLWNYEITTAGATHKVSEGIKNVRRLLGDEDHERLLRIHPRCTNLIRELQSYRYDENSHVATIGEPKPLKVDDHGPDALRYMTWDLRYND